MSSSDDIPATKSVAEGVLLKVRAAPGASRDRIAGLHGDALKIAVCAPPEKGKANEAITRVLARALGRRRSTVMVASGGTSRDKWILVEDIELETLIEKLEELL